MISFCSRSFSVAGVGFNSQFSTIKMPSVDILQQCNGARRALLVKEPWASQLVTGKKTMELRSTRCSMRETVAIARIGTSQIIGTCRIDIVSGVVITFTYNIGL